MFAGHCQCSLFTSRAFRFRKMIDPGGGQGLYAIVLASLNPDLDAYLFDLPFVIPQAKACISKYGTQKVHTITGNFFHRWFREGYDLILSFSNPSGKSLDLLPVIVRVLNARGIFC